MLRRLGLVLTPTAAAAATGYYFRDDMKAFAATLVDTRSSSSSLSSSGYYPDDFPKKPWDHNWDLRDPLSLVDQREYEKADADKRKEMVAKQRPTATRHIILIRHGQYVLDTKDPVERKLTPLGREQAALLGKRLSETGLKYDQLVMSTMPRASETANIILDKLSSVAYKSDSLLEEGAPYPPEPVSYHWRPAKKKFFTEGARIEAAFRKYIHRASVHQKEDSYELIVCHANVIRYFICRALQFPPEGWLRMSLGNASITWIAIRPNGNVSIRCAGDVGHLHPDKITFT
uniref:Serine/threonine-protein phosphatase PGAM5, mitochondrial n=1 Tax=Panagrellus redivivus TaxID=6233 RepID=A0A7E4ZUK1_PANRE